MNLKFCQAKFDPAHAGGFLRIVSNCGVLMRAELAMSISDLELKLVAATVSPQISSAAKLATTPQNVIVRYETLKLIVIFLFTVLMMYFSLKIFFSLIEHCKP